MLTNETYCHKMEKQLDQQLFTALKNGSETAFTAVYEDNRALFLNFGRKYGLADEVLLDVYQDAYIAFYENIKNGKLVVLNSKIATYLISIGKFKIMEQLRKNKKNIHHDGLLSIAHETDDEIENFDIVQEDLSKEQKVMQLYFDALGEKCQDILKMFYYKNYTIKQIVKEGGYNSENVAKATKSRCLKSLKDAIKNAPKL